MKNKKQGDRDILSPGTDEDDRLTSTPLKTNGFHHDDDFDNDGGLLQRKVTKSRQLGCGKIGRISFLEPDSPPSTTAKGNLTLPNE